MPHLYIISGCNGAGKTTASFTILPEMLNIDEFINADEIARGLSPLNPVNANIEAGRLMLTKIKRLIQNQKDFAFETTLATKSYANTIMEAHKQDYTVTLIFFWLDSVDLANERIKTRVLDGGHHVPANVVTRRYNAGIANLFHLYIPLCDYWIIFDNSSIPANLVAEGHFDKDKHIKNSSIFDRLKNFAIHE